jgi:hypothetical protein
MKNQVENPVCNCGSSEKALTVMVKACRMPSLGWPDVRVVYDLLSSSKV